MPKEMRRLIFAEKELIVALSEQNKLSKQQLPPGNIVGCTLVDRGQTAVSVEITSERNGEAQNVEITPEEVSEALVGYCIRRKIPLPKDAKKLINQMGGDICLDVHVPLRNYDEQERDRPDWWDAVQKEDQS